LVGPGSGRAKLLLSRSNSKRPYTLATIDFFAAYVITQDAWYLIPARVLLGKVRKERLTLCPMQRAKADRYSYECYREAWRLLRPKPEQPKKKEPWRGRR
jgi:hypothetical protein